MLSLSKHAADKLSVLSCPNALAALAKSGTIATIEKQERQIMDFVLSEAEIRVLGSLVEKEFTTPEYYPLSLNALVNACNQKTNREPVVSYDEDDVRDALDGLREKDLAIVCGPRDSRVLKYDNYLADKLGLSPAETAIMCVLMLRGPQTPGELNARTERMHAFEELSEIETTLDGLASREESPLVVKLPRPPGRKEYRYAHLLSGEVAVDSTEADTGAESTREKVERLEAQMEALLREHEEFRREFAEFRKQFE
jgi:uncharacterized protein YceH (UPF0502 family)